MIEKLENNDFCIDNVQHVTCRISGNRVRLVEIIPKFPKKQTSRSHKYKKLDNGRFQSSMTRTRTRVQEHILNNFQVKKSSFVTLTYKQRVIEDDYNDAINHFYSFIRRLRRKHPNFKYLVVCEKQREFDYKGEPNGRLHFHILIDRLFTGDYIQNVWGRGSCDSIVTSGKMAKLANYMSKYLTKHLFLPVGRQSYLVSQNLNKSIVCNDFFKAYDMFHNIVSLSSGYTVDNLFVFSTGFGKIRLRDVYLD